jgi:hypothetical protein
MISLRPGSDAIRVLSVFASLEEPTDNEIAARTGGRIAHVREIVSRLREAGMLTGAEYRISNPDRLRRVGLPHYLGLLPDVGSMRWASSRDIEWAIVVVLDEGPLGRKGLAERCGFAPNDGCFSRALATCEWCGAITNHPALTDAGRKAVET